ncbi:PepSY domain-containing protein [Streptomyces sp. JNUCC 64]
MKRKVLIAAIAGALLVGGGTATAVAVAGGDGGDDRTVRESSVRLTEAEAREDARDDDADDKNERDDRNDDADDRDDRDDRDDDKNERDDDRDDRDGDERLPSGVKLSAADAITAALAERSGTAVAVDLEEDGGKVAWDVEIIDGKRDVYTVVIDPGNGKVLGSSLDKDDDGDDRDEVKADLAAAKAAPVSAVDAAKAAAAKGPVTSLDLDTERSSGAVWDVETVSGSHERDWTVSLDTAKAVPAKDGADDTDGDDD